MDGIDWINLLKDGWGALFGWLDRIGPPEGDGGLVRNKIKMGSKDVKTHWWMWREWRYLDVPGS